MPTAVWTGTLSFGLVNVPVRLVNATEPKDVRFHLYDRTGRRVRYERVVDAREDPGHGGAPRDAETASPSAAVDRDPPSAAVDRDPPTAFEATGQPEAGTVAWGDVRRGWENEVGEVVLLSSEEIEQVRPQRSRTIDVEDFVDLTDIDPVYFEKTYYAIPQSTEALRSYVLLHAAMSRAGRVGIGRFVLRTKPHLVAIRPMQGVLAVETLFFGDEVRDPATFAPGLSGAQVDEPELQLAMKLIEMLKTEWNPAAYADTYREDLLRILSEKVPTPVTATGEPPAGSASAVEQLMTALKESVDAVKARQPQSRRTRSRKAG
jgi:DNA end-binding protein Ku